MNNAPPPPPPSDPVYKRLYAFARMVEDLLRSLFTSAELDADYGTLTKLSTEHVGDALAPRQAGLAGALDAKGLLRDAVCGGTVRRICSIGESQGTTQCAAAQASFGKGLVRATPSAG